MRILASLREREWHRWRGDRATYYFIAASLLILIKYAVPYFYDLSNGHTASIYTVAWNAEGSRLISAGADHRETEVVSWDAETGKKLHREIYLVGAPQSLKLMRGPDSFVMMSILVVKDRRQWECWLTPFDENLESSQEPREIDRSFRGVVPLADRREMILYGPDSIQRTTFVGEAVQILFEKERDSVGEVSVSRNGRFVVASVGNRVLVWDLEAPQEYIELQAPEGPLGMVTIDSSGTHVIATRTRKGIRAGEYPVYFWDLQQGTELQEKLTFSGPVVQTNFIDEDEARLLILARTAANETTMDAYSPSGTLMEEIARIDEEVWMAVYSPTANQMAIETRNGFDMWSLNAGEAELTSSMREKGTRRVTWSPDGRKLAVSDYNKGLWIYSAKTGEIIHTLEPSNRPFWFNQVLLVLTAFLVSRGLAIAFPKAADSNGLGAAQRHVMERVSTHLGWELRERQAMPGLVDSEFVRKRSPGQFEYSLHGLVDGQPAILATFIWPALSSLALPAHRQLCMVFPEGGRGLTDVMISSGSP
ncbi:MAG: hypothetical protein CMJ46_02120 [Planctomyces sp.]|nr:hypothetical protein [Planctomyces sp.]